MNFFKGLFSVALIYTAFWVAYQFGFMNGADSERCTRRHSYHYDSALPAFAEVK
jgi:hypothetical protein